MTNSDFHTSLVRTHGVRARADVVATKLCIIAEKHAHRRKCYLVEHIKNQKYCQTHSCKRCSAGILSLDSSMHPFQVFEVVYVIHTLTSVLWNRQAQLGYAVSIGLQNFVLLPQRQ